MRNRNVLASPPRILRNRSKSPGRTSHTTERIMHHLPKVTPGNIQEEGFIDAMYQPRSLSALVSLVLAIIYATIIHEREFLDSEEIHGHRIKYGLLISSGAFLMYCMCQLRDGSLLRPHPAVWRVVHGTGLLYLMLLVYLLCQDTNGIHQFLQLFDPRVGTPTGEHSYGDDCRIIKNDSDPYGNLRDQFLDRFTLAHFLGWTIKAIILRDWVFMWVASVLFEIMEVTFQHLYPNFNECWWDHIFLDVLGCNLAGMVFGMYLVHKLQGHKFDWRGNRVDRLVTTMGKMKRVALQFSPYSFDIFRWQVFESWRHFVVCVTIMSILMLGELNAFFLKTTFQIPINSNINLYRLTFWSFLTYMATFEYYRFAERKTRRIGVNAWLATTLVCMETLLVGKHIYRNSMFQHTTILPAAYIITGWAVTAVLFMILGVVKSARKVLVWKRGAREVFSTSDITSRVSRHAPEQTLMDVVTLKQIAYLDQIFQILTFLIPVPLLVVLAMDCYRTMSYPPPQPGTGGW